ncbi:hypothetical protein C8Q76DRAFT_787597 [Earliella scabrosa]|nr:hypothetical protein C8Q76DRAFT_787597 [Earliella scabrosa]
MRKDVPTRPQAPSSVIQRDSQPEEEENTIEDFERQTGEWNDGGDDNYEERARSRANPLPSQPATAASLPRKALHQPTQGHQPPLGHVSMFQPSPGSAASATSPSLGLSPSPALADATVTNTRKRAAPDSETEEEKQARRRAKKAAQNAKRPTHTSLGDDPPFQKAVSTASSLVKCYLVTVNAYPSGKEKDNMLEQKFREALEQHFGDSNAYPFTNAVKSLLAKEENNVRTSLKTIALAAIEQYYDLRRDPQATTRNRDKVTFLLSEKEKYPFQRANPQVDEKLYRHPILAHVLHQAFFKTSSSLGAVYQANFNPIPFPAIALVATVVYHCLSCWSQGFYVKDLFRNSMYTQYDIFGKELIPMETGKLAGPWAILRKKMFIDGLSGCGALTAKATQPELAPLSPSRIDRELAALNEELGLDAFSNPLADWDIQAPASSASEATESTAPSNGGMSQPQYDATQFDPLSTEDLDAAPQKMRLPTEQLASHRQSWTGFLMYHERIILRQRRFPKVTFTAIVHVPVQKSRSSLAELSAHERAAVERPVVVVKPAEDLDDNVVGWRDD